MGINDSSFRFNLAASRRRRRCLNPLTQTLFCFHRQTFSRVLWLYTLPGSIVTWKWTTKECLKSNSCIIHLTRLHPSDESYFWVFSLFIPTSRWVRNEWAKRSKIPVTSFTLHTPNRLCKCKNDLMNETFFFDSFFYASLSRSVERSRVAEHVWEGAYV